jgi:hypothetical protein
VLLETRTASILHRLPHLRRYTPQAVGTLSFHTNEEGVR